MMENITLGKNVTIEEGAIIGKNLMIFDNSFVRSGAQIGDNCKIARGVYVDGMAVMGNNVKIQNRNNISNGVILKDGVFVGPNVTFSNDKNPRSVTPDGVLKTNVDWVLSQTIIEEGASLGAAAVLVCGITVGAWAMIGAGAVVTKSIPPYALAMGNPARIKGWVSRSGFKMELVETDDSWAYFFCQHENETYKIPQVDYSQMM